MSGIERIYNGSTLLAVVVRRDFQAQGNNFISEEKYPLQFGVNFYTRGHEIKPHVHNEREVVIKDFQEFVHVDSGKVAANLYEIDGKLFRSIELNAGDSIFLIEGGHGFSILEDARLSNIKQGPYFGKEFDKKML